MYTTKNIEIDYKQKFINLVMNTLHEPVRLQYEGIETTVIVYFNKPLIEDSRGIFSLYYYSTFDTPNAELVADLNGVPVADGKRIKGNAYQFKTLAPISGIKLTAVAIGLDRAQHTLTESVIFPTEKRLRPNTIFLNSYIETRY